MSATLRTDNDEQYDVYGCSDETREWEHDWRLSVRIVDE